MALSEDQQFISQAKDEGLDLSEFDWSQPDVVDEALWNGAVLAAAIRIVCRDCRFNVDRLSLKMGVSRVALYRYLSHQAPKRAFIVEALIDKLSEIREQYGRKLKVIA
jgi:hypothetical protein